MSKDQISEKEFQTIAKWQRSFSQKISARRKQPEKIDLLVGSIVKQVKPKQNKFSSLSKIWNEILPADMAVCSSIAEFQRGTLKVKVDSPARIYQFNMISRQLLDELNAQAGRSKIKSIKFEL